jgi:hypothetical protein
MKNPQTILVVPIIVVLSLVTGIVCADDPLPS